MYICVRGGGGRGGGVCVCVCGCDWVGVYVGVIPWVGKEVCRWGKGECVCVCV